MTRTSQLAAHYAVLQLDALREKVVMSFGPTVEMLIAEFDEQHAGVSVFTPKRQRAHERRLKQFVRLRAAVLELSSALVALRCGCGTDPKDLPHGDDDVVAEFSRIRAAHEKHRREQAGEPVDDDVDEMLERHHESLVDYAAREGGAE
jgi:hypothetical protein